MAKKRGAPTRECEKCGTGYHPRAATCPKCGAANPKARKSGYTLRKRKVAKKKVSRVIASGPATAADPLEAAIAFVEKVGGLKAQAALDRIHRIKSL